MRIIISVCNVISRSNYNCNVDEFNIETYEDMYLYTLLQLYLTYKS